MPVTRRYYTPGFHSDVIWLEDQRDYAVVLLGCMEQNLQACRADPGFGVFLHELTYLKPYLDSRPAERQFVFDLVRAGRVGFGGAHSLPSENLISGEALIRNFAFGRVYHEYLGDKPEIAMLWDVFGHCSQLPQMLVGLRFSGLIWSKDIRGAQPLFWHLGLDGTKLLTRRVMYGQPVNPQEACEQYVDDFLPELESLGHTVDLRLGCNDFMPPAPWLVGGCEAIAAREVLPWTVSGQAHRLYFRDLHRALRSKRLKAPVSARDFEYHHMGTGLTHIDLKILNRRCENVLIEAEKFSTLAFGHGLPYPHLSLDKAWRQLFFGQHHDAITGPCNDRSYLDLMDGYRETLELSEAALARAQTYLAEQTDTTGGGADSQALVVFNGNNWAREDVVEVSIDLPESSTSVAISDAEGCPVLFEVASASGGRLRLRFVASVPGLGTALYHIAPVSGKLPKPKRRQGLAIENEFLRLEVDSTHGGLISIFDKRLAKELLTGEAPGNELVALAEDFEGEPEPPWELHTSGAQVYSRDFPAEIEVREGPISSTIIVRGPFKDCRREQRLTLYRGVPRVEFTTELSRYEGREEIFGVTVPADLPGVSPVFEDRFGCVVKRRSRGKFDFRTWQWRNYSDCGARRAHQWVDLSSSARLLFVADEEVRSSYALGPMSLVASDVAGEEALGALQEALVKRGVTSTIFRDDCERQRRAGLPREDSLMPIESPNEDLPWGTAFRVIADVSDQNLLWRLLRAALPAATLAAFDQRRERDGGALLFAMDSNLPKGWPPLPTLIVSGRDAPGLEMALRGLARELSRTGDLRLPAEYDLSPSPAQLPGHGLAMLNRGTPLHSLEADGTLMLMLMHSVLWARTKWGPDRLDFHLVAEHKTHRFEYALYPHAGDWREGDVPRAAYDYSNTLKAVVTQCHCGPLVAGQSLCEVSGGIVTALKPAGYPYARGAEPVAAPAVLRVYEPFGAAGALRVAWPGGLAEIERANLLDEAQATVAPQDGQLQARLKPFEIASYLLTPTHDTKTVPVVADEKEEGVLPARYWAQNVGEAPMGYMPLALSLSGEVKTDTHVMHGGYTVNEVKVGVANNLDRAVRGQVRLLAAEGWRTVPEVVEFDLQPLTGAEYPVTVVFDDDRRRDGLLRAQLEWEGQVYEDTLVIGAPPPPSWQARRESRWVVVNITNPGADALHADLTLITPHETWQEIGEARPRRFPLALAPGEQRRCEFLLAPKRGYSRDDSWAVLKLAYWGRVEYRPL